MSQFHHSGNLLFRKNKSFTINESIPPLRQSLIKKNTNYPKSVSQFHNCGNSLLRKTQIIQNKSVNYTTAAVPY